MLDENSKQKEIKRLTSNLTFIGFKAYDCENMEVNCIESLYDVNFIIEPKNGILSDDEVLKYAPKSKLASKIKLKNGNGDFYDVLLIHDSIVWILGVYYMFIACFTISFSNNMFWMFLSLILFVLPLFYLYHIFNLNNYISNNRSKVRKPVNDISKPLKVNVDSFNKYRSVIDELKILFDTKEETVRDLIGKRFEPPQITYDRFIVTIDNSHKLFYNQFDSAREIINLSVENTPRVENEIEDKINSMKLIINHIEDLTNELVINISSDSKSSNDIKNLIEDMDNLIDSVKDY